MSVPDRKATVHVAGDPGIECLDCEARFRRVQLVAINPSGGTGGSSRVGSDRDVGKVLYESIAK